MNYIQIGVTGHRILAKNHNIENGIRQVMAAVETRYPNFEWIVYSSLAEGADCIFVYYALERLNVKLIVPLPFSLEEYSAEFTSQQNRDVFWGLYERAYQTVIMPPRPTREAAYWTASEYILDRAQLIVAIWDGQEPQGVGGTGQFVNEVRRRQMPLAWIQAGNRRKGSTEPTHLGKKQGKVNYERF